MKRIFALLLAVLCLSVSGALAVAWYCPVCRMFNEGNYCPNDGTHYSSVPLWDPVIPDPVLPWQPADPWTDPVPAAPEVWALALKRISTRTGPATEYTEPGTFELAGEYIRLISISRDSGGVEWVQCEIYSNGKPIRAYAGIKRFDPDTFDPDLLPRESRYPVLAARLLDSCVPQCGPGYGYARMKDITLCADYLVRLITTENGWAQIEFELTDHICRCWVPESIISIVY